MEDPTIEEQTEANIVEPETEQNDVDLNPDLDQESEQEPELKNEDDNNEQDQEEDTVEEQPRCSVSPKIARPKLPEFTGNGRISSHARSKTDPGRGGEIKAIIDKTMEDIKELNKVDFTIYNRPKVFPKPLHQRSQSTHASPRASPTPSSPSVEEKVSALNRNRSRSLKVLTDMLKSGRGGNDFRSGNIPDVGNDVKSSSDSQLLPRRQKEGKESSVERRSSSDGQLQANRQDSSGEVTDEPRISDARTPDIYSQQKEFGQSDRHYSDHSEQKHKGSTIPRYRQESGKFRRAKSEVRKAAPVSDDEGLDVTSDHESGGQGLVKPFHSIDTNSKFFTLYKTNPSKRRPQFSGFVKTRYKSNSQGEEQGTRPDDQIGSASRRFTRLELTPLSSKTAKSRLSSLRHVTHPPQSQTTFREGGTMDSNGFGTLLKSPSTESPPPFPGDAEKTSDLSLTDSQTGQSDSMDEASYGEQDDQSETQTESCDNASDVDTIKPAAEKKSNGKTLKQKSKSDPSSDKSQSIDQSELPQLITVSQSTPHLSTESSQDVEEEEVTPDTTIDTDSQEEEKRRRTLSAHQSFDEETPLQFDATSSTGGSGSPMSYSIEEEGLLSPDSDGPPPSFVSVMCGVTSAPSTPANQSPTNTLERTNYLNVPTSVTISSTSNNKKSIGRSASSASVLHRERKFSGGNKEKETIRKHSVTIGDDSASTPKPELFPLGDNSGMQALSMPSMTSSWKKERGPSMSPERDQSLVKDKRYHIVEEFYHNEKEYVEALQKLKDKYMTPLKVSSNIDEAVVDNIFYMIPEILTHHTIYLDFLENVWAKWDTKTSTIGNIIIGIFSKQTVVDSYLSFVENYRTSGKVIENALQTKSSVQKFLEQCQRDSGSKLSMKDLIVRPIQRIPRYELLIQRLIENTPHDHPDFPLLKEAERVMHNFAIKLGTNENQLEEDQQSTLKKLELLVPDMSPLVAPDRQYLKHDMVQILTKKDQCCIWIFSDLVIFSSVKRRGGPVTRKVSVILKSPTGNEYAENIKHKVWLRVGLDNIEIVKSQIQPIKKSSLDPDQLEEDINILTEMSEMTNKLNYPHSSLDDVVKEMLTSLNKQLSEVSIRSPSLESNKMEILVTTQEGVYPLEICFNSAEKRAIWESTLLDAKQKLSLLSDKRAPEFQQPLQITKTRAGMQFSCAAPIDGLNNSGYRDVWVCNSDGYVGHMCLLSLQPEPIVTLNTPVPGCNARILCICAVPAYSGPFRRKSSSKKNLHKHSVPPVAEDSPQINIEEVDDVSEPEEDAASGYQTDSESSEEEEEEELEEEVEGEKEIEGEEEVQQEKEEGGGETVFDNKPKDLYLGDSPEGKASPVSQLINLDPFTMTGNWLQDAHKSTMWLGTEDGCIHIFQCTDNIKTTKNKLKIHHGSPVYCIVYLDNKVFVSLANGDLIVYKRDSDGIWDTENPYTRTVGSVISPISRMLAVAGKLWCGCQNVMNVINPLTLRIETTFQVTTDSSRCIQCLVCAGQGVWLASQQSSKISLYHATSFEPLLEVNIAHSVAQKLQSADDIIRQHKAACLRITALLVCKDLLWVGTSAGVILTIPMPRITSTSTRGSISTPSVTGLVFGHTGHVRFLTCVELTAPSSPTTPKARTEDEETDDKPDNLAIHDIHRRSSMAATTATMATRMLVISGGDGYEDFRNNSTNEVAGRDDSTNHLLLWQV